MASRNVRSWQIRLGAAPVIILIGTVVSTICLSFFSGYFFGHTVGFQVARETTLTTAPHMPVVSDARSEDDTAHEISDIYAKLNEPATLADEVAKVQDHKPKRDPKSGKIEEKLDVASIPTTAESPFLEDDESEGQLGEGKSAEKSSGISLGAASLGSGHSSGERAAEKAGNRNKKKNDSVPETLGALVDEKTERLEAEFAKEKREDQVVARASLHPERDEQAEKRRQEEAASAAREKAAELKREAAEAKKAVELKKVAEAKETAKQKIAERAAEKAKAEKAQKEALAKSEVAKLSAKVNEPQSRDNQTKVGARVPRGWFAQVAAPRKSDDAQFLARQLNKSGFSAIVETARVDGQEYYRVLVGPERSRDQTTRLVKQLMREPFMQGEPFPRYVP